MVQVLGNNLLCSNSCIVLWLLRSVLCAALFLRPLSFCSPGLPPMHAKHRLYHGLGICHAIGSCLGVSSTCHRSEVRFSHSLAASRSHVLACKKG